LEAACADRQHVRQLAARDQGGSLRSRGGPHDSAGQLLPRAAGQHLRQYDPYNPKFRAFPNYNEKLLAGEDFRIRERLRADFRAEMFNAFNRSRFGQGSLTIQSQTFGILSQTAGDQINSPRQMQLALKLYF
jgi:hypothetical protein